MRVVYPVDATEFLEHAAPLLFADEARHNLILGLAGTLRDQAPSTRRRSSVAAAMRAHSSQRSHRRASTRGDNFCFLYTDLANPTSSKIYLDLGYERVCDSIELDFSP